MNFTGVADKDECAENVILTHIRVAFIKTTRLQAVNDEIFAEMSVERRTVFYLKLNFEKTS